MSKIISSIGSAADTLCMSFINAAVQVKTCVLWLGKKVSLAMKDVYSLEGFEKWSKAFIADLRILNLFNVNIKNCLKTVEAQKDLIYATLIFGSTVEFFKPGKDKDGKKVYGFQLPREKDGNVDVVKFLYGIGNIFETLKFTQEYGLLSFPRCSQLANQLGSTKLFNFRGSTWTLGDIPVANCWLDKPKDFFVFTAAFYNTGRCLTVPVFFTIENILKLTGSIGKMTLITLAPYMLREKYYTALSIVDFVTNNASLLAFLIKRNNDREKRLQDPTKA